MASPVPPQREGLLVWVQVCSRSARSARRENRRTHALPPSSRLCAATPPRAPAPNPPPPRARRNAPSVACAQVASRTYSPAWDESFELVVAAVWNVITVRVRHAARADAPSRQDTTIGMVCVPLGGVVSWRGVTSGADGRFKAIYRPLKDPGRFKFCTARDPATGQEADSFATAEEAAQAYDATALATDGEEAALNFAGRTGLLGAHAREAAFPLAGANGLPVLGVQASPGARAPARRGFPPGELEIKRSGCNRFRTPYGLGSARRGSGRAARARRRSPIRAFPAPPQPIRVVAAPSGCPIPASEPKGGPFALARASAANPASGLTVRREHGRAGGGLLGAAAPPEVLSGPRGVRREGNGVGGVLLTGTPLFKPRAGSAAAVRARALPAARIRARAGCGGLRAVKTRLTPASREGRTSRTMSGAARPPASLSSPASECPSPRERALPSGTGTGGAFSAIAGQNCVGPARARASGAWAPSFAPRARAPPRRARHQRTSAPAQAGVDYLEVHLDRCCGLRAA